MVNNQLNKTHATGVIEIYLLHLEKLGPFPTNEFVTFLGTFNL